MTDLKGKVIVVTGAASGIGEATAEVLVAAGCKVVGCDVDEGRLQNVAERLNKDGEGEMFAVKCDVSEEGDVKSVFKFVEEKFKTLQAVVNNAGIVKAEPLLTGKTEHWMKMLQINVLGVAVCSREAIQLMRRCNVDDGHVVNMSSIAGKIVVPIPIMHFYCATKFAVTALSEGLRQELRMEKSHIRVTALFPAVVNTPIYAKANHEVANELLKGYASLQPVDVAKSILYAISAPARVDVSEMLLRPYENPL